MLEVDYYNKFKDKELDILIETCDKGYYNVTCVDIARYAGVSTGIIYQYFNDKRDIFLAGVRNYSNSVMFPMNEVLDTVCFDVSKIDDFISLMIDRFIMGEE